MYITNACDFPMPSSAALSLTSLPCLHLRSADMKKPPIPRTLLSLSKKWEAVHSRTRAFLLHPGEFPGGVSGKNDDVVGDVGAVGREGDDVDVSKLALEGLDVLVQEHRFRALER